MAAEAGNCRCCRRESAAPLSLSAAAEGPRMATGATDRPRPTRAAEAVESAHHASDAVLLRIVSCGRVAVDK